MNKIKLSILSVLLLASPAFADITGDVLLRNVAGHPEFALQTKGLGVPSDFSQSMQVSKYFFIQNGQLNKFRIRPCIVNEHAESSRMIQGTVNSSTVIGQIFKASSPNICDLLLTLEPSITGTSLDDFESYANDAALQVEWVEGTNAATVETGIVNGGSQSMKLSTQTLNDTWTDTVGSTNLENVTFELAAYQTAPYSNQKVSFFIGDGTNTKSTSLVADAPDQWNSFDIIESDMTEDGGGTTNSAAITKIGFRVDDQDPGDFVYIDDLTYEAAPGELDIILWDMGASMPDSGVTALTDGAHVDSIGDRGISGTIGDTKLRIELKGGKHMYTMPLTHGVALEIPNEDTLTVDNYYAISLHYVDTNVSVFGPDTTFAYDYYTEGYSFSVADSSTAIDKINRYGDLMFAVMSAQDIYISKAEIRFTGTPGNNADFKLYSEGTNMEFLTGFAIDEQVIPQFFTEDITVPSYLPLGGKFEAYYNDDPADTVSAAAFSMEYYYKPPTPNGSPAAATIFD